MAKKQDTLTTDYDDIEDVFDHEFIEQEFINELNEWRETNLYEENADSFS